MRYLDALVYYIVIFVIDRKFSLFIENLYLIHFFHSLGYYQCVYSGTVNQLVTAGTLCGSGLLFDVCILIFF